MAKRLLLEDTWQFRPDRKRIVESTVGTRKISTIPGVLSQCDVVNGNNRIYPRPVWEENLRDGSPLQLRIAARKAYGTLEHPSDGIVGYGSPISHAVTKAELLPDGTVAGEITIIDSLPDGAKLRALIEFGDDPLVSSRGYGTVVRNANGIDEVQSDYVCEGWDVVMNPSFQKAQLTPARDAEVVVTAESTRTTAPSGTVVESQSTATVGPPKLTTNNTMDINGARALVHALGQVNILSASPQTVAESFTQATQLHRQLAEAQATTPAIAWDAAQLNESLRTVENNWVASIQKVQESAKQLQEDRAKLLTLSESLVKLAKTYRTQLTDAAKKSVATAKLYEGVCQRGRGWHKIAVNRSDKISTLEHQVRVACAAIDILSRQVVEAESGRNRKTVVGRALEQLAAQYHADTARMARKIVELRFPDAAKDQKIAEQLKKTATAADVLKVIEQLERAAKPATAAKPAVAESVPTRTTESAAASVPASPASATATTVVLEGTTAVRSVEPLGHYISADQAIAVASRMSPSAKQ